MATNALTGSHIATFKGIELHKFLSVITDTRGPRTVVHEFPYRDGANVETLGRKPHQSEWQITFTGPDWLETFLGLANSIDESPAGLLVHPIYGQMQVVCAGFNRAIVNVVEATDTIVIPLTFIEDQTDLGIAESTSAGSLTQDTNAAIADFNSQAAAYAAAATQAAVTTFSGAASTFSAAALVSVQNNSVDPSLSLQISDIGAALSAVEAALQLDPLALSSVAQVYDVLAAAEVVYALCLQLSDEIALETLSFVKHVVEGRTSISVLAQRLYGNRAIDKIDQMLALNPQITDPTAIPAGIVLTLPAV